MTVGYATKLIIAGVITWGILLMLPKTNVLLNPDTKLFGFHGLIELFCMITGCRIMPVGAGAVFVMITISLLFTNEPLTVAIITGVVLISLRIWKMIVVYNNPDMP